MRRGRSPGVLAAAAVVSLVVGRSAPAARGEVVAIVSKDIAPYKRALAGVVRTLPGNPVEVLDRDEEVVLKRVKDRNPAVIIAIGAKAAKLIHSWIRDVPIVYCLVLDPTGNDLVDSGVWGVPFEPSLRDEVQVLKRAFPQATRVGVVMNPTRPPPDFEADVLAAQKSGVTVAVERASEASELPAAAARLAPKVDGLAILADPSLVTRDTFKSVVELATARKLPVIGATEESARLGALISLYMEYEEAGHDAAAVAQQIASGRKAAEVSVPKPNWKVVVNLSTAEAIGAHLAPEVLASAHTTR